MNLTAIDALIVAVSDPAAAATAYHRLGLAATEDGWVLGSTAMRFVPARERTGLIAVAVRGAGPEAAAVGLVPSDGPPTAGPSHSFPLRRLDHLASVAHDLEATTRFWVETLGVPIAGEVPTPTMLIRQFRLGDAMFELLGPTSTESPIHARLPGLVSMASWEVPDLHAAVAQARAAGFTPNDPAIGLLPGTLIATIPGVELAGVSMQLLQYV